MRVSPRYHLIKIALVLIWAQGVLAKRRNYQCPLGFEIAFTDDGSPICYRQKGPEAFNDKFVNCAGNLFSSKLYHSLNFTKTKQIVWTEYKSLYPGGPYIDWSYTDSTGDVLRSTFDVNYDSSLGIDDELCVVVDPVSNFTAASCDGKFYRYCFVKPYDEDDKSRKGCTSLGDSYRFYSPVSTCLSAVTGVGGGTVRATWRQATELCSKRGGSLLNRGWRYSNNPLLHVSGSLPVYPLGLVMSSNLTTLRYDTLDDMSEIPPAEWMFDNVNSTTSHIDSIYGAVANNFWRLVNNSFLFYDVICEHQHPLTALNMILTVDEDSKIVLSVNDSIKKNDIHCFTDSMIYYPTEVSISKGDDDHTFRVIPAFDGYYWCIQMNHKKYMPSESNKALFIISKESLVNLYACKIRLKKEYRFDNLDKLNRVWKKKLDEYIYYKTKYEAIYGTLESNQTEQVLQKFKGEHPELDWKDSDVIYGLKIKRLYVDARSALVHIMLNPEMSPVPPGIWDHIELIYMKPAYYCKGFDSIPTSELGASVTSAGCRTYTCVGDFNEGVQWVETSTSPCATNPTVMIRTDNVNYPESTRTPQVTKVEPSIGEVPSKEPDNTSSDESFENTTTASTTTKSSTIATSTTPCLIIETTESSWPTTTESSWPTTTDATPTDEVTLFPVTIVPWTTTQPTTTTEPIPPEEQLQQVLGELELLLKNDTVSIENIERPFDQVNDILDGEDDDLEIPGQLLHLLDELAFRVKLTDSQAITVRDNVALLMADVTPENPIRGVRMAARDYDAFSNNSFGFIDGNLNASQLLTNASEAVVYLPASVSAAARRVSFVAFRNQRAFQSTLPVNSRVFSVNVENLTTFENGENLVFISFQKCNINQPKPWFSSSTDFNKMVSSNQGFILSLSNHNRLLSILLHYDGTFVMVTYEANTMIIKCIQDKVGSDSADGLKTYSLINEDLLQESSEESEVSSTPVIKPQSEGTVDQVLDDLEVLLRNDTVLISAGQVDKVMDRVDTLLELNTDVEIPSNLLMKLDKLGTRFSLDSEATGQVVRNNFAVLSADVVPEKEFRGIRLAASSENTFTPYSFEFVKGPVLDLSSEESDAIALLPPSTTNSHRRISFVAFRTDRAFQRDHECVLNSKVISINVENFTGFEDGEMVEIYLNPLERKINRDQRRVCAYWHFDGNDLGHWSQDGCSLIPSTKGKLDLCRCNHLTHFAEILVQRNVFSILNEQILEVISIIGCSFSIFGITCIAITAAVFKSWRRNDSNKVWLHLCSAVYLLNICFLVTVSVEFDQTDISCSIIGVSLHYSVLATFCWMLSISILSYRKLVLVFSSEIRYKLYLASLFSWGFPILVIGILLAVNPLSYSGKFEEMAPSGGFCYPKGVALWLTVFTPIAIMWFINWILYGIIVKSLFERRNLRKHNDSNDILRSSSVSCLLAFLCGIPWVFGFFAKNIVAAYLFTITVTFQGFILFLFFVIGNKNTRDLWINLTKSKFTKTDTVTTTEMLNKSRSTNTTRFYLDESSSELLEDTRL